MHLGGVVAQLDAQLDEAAAADAQLASVSKQNDRRKKEQKTNQLKYEFKQNLLRKKIIRAQTLWS